MKRMPSVLLLAVLAAALGCADSPHADWVAYADADNQVRFDYPPELTLTERAGETLSVQLLHEGRRVMSLAAYDAGMEGAIRLYTIEGSERSIEVGGIEATGFEVQDQSDGEGGWPDGRIPHVLVKHGDRIFVFTGSGDRFDEILRTVRFGT